MAKRPAPKRIKLSIFDSDASGASTRSTVHLGPVAAEQWRREQERRALHVRHRAPASPTEALTQSPQSPDNAHEPPPFSPQEDGETADGLPGSITREILDEFVNQQLSAPLLMSGSYNWGIRRATARRSWNQQLDGLVDAYLGFVHSIAASGAPPPAVYPHNIVPPETISSTPLGSVILVDMSGVYSVPFATFSATGPANVGLIRQGYLGSAPVRPSIAFSLRILLAFLRLRTRARTGKHNFARVLCDLHNIPFTVTFRNRMADAVDALSAILRAVDNRIAATLGRDNDWRMRNACPACAYKCDGEDTMTFARQFTIDGNNSMKRFLGAGTRFDDAYPLQYILTRAEVDLCKDEVSRTRTSSAGMLPDATADISDPAGGGDSECLQRWRNARPDGEKASSWDALDETGVFPCICRHGLIVIATDMWKSGELAKYPLAIVRKLLDLFKHEGRLQVGYDIGCAHSGTAARSSFGEDVKNSIRFVVGSFHGHAHNRLCQLRFHPRFIDGSGREDFEGCERLFSVNNFIAPLIQHATPFHRHELIEAAFKTWDSEKYASLGSLLLSKFRDARKKIEEHATTEARRLENPQYTPEFFSSLLEEERDYLAGLAPISQVRVEDDLRKEYAAALRRWWTACAERNRLGGAGIQFVAYRAPGNRDTANRKWLAAQQRVQRCENDLQGYESRLDVTERWTNGCAEYLDAVQMEQRQAFNTALDALERCVVDRLAVLEKLNQRGTGYNMRKHIAKAVNRRGSALATALQKYNDAAIALVPPRPTLTREQVLEVAFLADFPLLRLEVASRPWAQPSVRAMTTAWAETARANEEIARIRIELVRIRTWIRDEEAFLDARIAQLDASNAAADRLLARELDARAQLLFHTHSEILRDLARLDTEDGLAVLRGPGRHIGGAAVAARVPRSASRIRLPCLPLDAVRTLSGIADRSANEQGVSDAADHGLGEAGFDMDEVEGERLNAFMTAVREIAS